MTTRRSARLAREPCSISELPDATLGRILALAGDRKTIGPVACLVCQRWRAAIFGEPSFWRAFLLRPQYLFNLEAAERQSWLEVRRRVLERVGVVVAHLTLQFDAHGAALVSPHSLADFLHLLRPAGLSGLRLSCGALPAAVAAEARRFTALTALHLSAAALEESHVRPWLVALPRLEKLTCDGPLPAWLPAALAALPALSQLALHTTGNHQFPEELQLLTGLVTLTSLHLETSRSLPGAASALTGLTALRALTVVCSGRAWRLPALAEFAALQSYRLRTEGVKLAGAKLCGVECAVGEHDAQLKLWEVDRLPSLAQLLDQLLPAGAALASLTFWQARLEAAAVEGCARLSSLTRLALHGCDTPWHPSDVPAVVAALLPAAPRLAELHLTGCSLREIPACVADMQGLTRLVLEHNELCKKIPRGPYLAELAELDLSWNHVGRLPVALKRAPQLRRLSLHGNNPLDAKDVEGVLARMPSLEWLDLSNTGTPEAMIRALHARLPRLAIQLSSRRSYP